MGAHYARACSAGKSRGREAALSTRRVAQGPYSAHETPRVRRLDGRIRSRRASPGSSVAARPQHLLSPVPALARPPDARLLRRPTARRGVPAGLAGPGGDGPEALGRGPRVGARPGPAPRDRWRRHPAPDGRRLPAGRSDAAPRHRARRRDGLAHRPRARGERPVRDAARARRAARRDRRAPAARGAEPGEGRGAEDRHREPQGAAGLADARADRGRRAPTSSARTSTPATRCSWPRTR